MSIQDFNCKPNVRIPITTFSISPQNGRGHVNFFDIDYLKNNQVRLLPGGTLTICFEVIKPGPESAVSCLSKDLEDSMNDLEFTDCEIQTSEGIIKVHRIIIATRSPVFKERDFSFFTFEK